MKITFIDCLIYRDDKEEKPLYFELEVDNL